MEGRKKRRKVRQEKVKRKVGMNESMIGSISENVRS